MKPSEVYLNAAKKLEAYMPMNITWSAYYDFLTGDPSSVQRLDRYAWTDEGKDFMALFGIAALTKHEAIIALCLMAAIAESEGE